jgi:hypothetical protein
MRKKSQALKKSQARAKLFNLTGATNQKELTAHTIEFLGIQLSTRHPVSPINSGFRHIILFAQPGTKYKIVTGAWFSPLH